MGLPWTEALRRAFPDAQIALEAPLKQYTTFRIGGPAEALWEIGSEGELFQALAFCRREGVPYAVLGNGSNTLAPDEGLRALVLHLGRRMAGVRREGAVLIAEGGAFLPAVSRLAAKAGLTGLEFAAGIPGSVGGAVRMNAGAYGGQMSDVVASVRAVSSEGEVRVIERDRMRFGYRHSLLCEERLYATKVHLSLRRGDRETIEGCIEELSARRRARQPLQLPSAGSVFKRPEGNFAGRLIEAAGAKGLRVGGAEVSGLHANFIVNTGGATAADVLELIGLVQRRVHETSGVWLETEVCPLRAERPHV